MALYDNWGTINWTYPCGNFYDNKYNKYNRDNDIITRTIADIHGRHGELYYHTDNRGYPRTTYDQQFGAYLSYCVVLVVYVVLVVVKNLHMDMPQLCCIFFGEHEHIGCLRIWENDNKDNTIGVFTANRIPVRNWKSVKKRRKKPWKSVNFLCFIPWKSVKKRRKKPWKSVICRCLCPVYK